MKNFIVGELIYSSGNLKVTKHALGFTITDGENVKSTPEMPLLNNKNLYTLLGVKLDPYQNWQLKKHGNVLPSKTTTSFQKTDVEIFTDNLNNHHEAIMNDHWNY